MLGKLRSVLHRLKYKRAISAATLEGRFSNIYQYNLWFGNSESRSGAGSTLEATENLRIQLPAILEKYDAKNLVDVGCGDFNWMKEVKLPCRYVGLDIVPQIVQSNQEKFGNESVEFVTANAVVDPLPTGADIVLCREVLFHLSFDDGRNLLRNVIASGARYFIATNDLHVEKNKNIKSGAFRNLNLKLPPYFFPESVDQIMDNHVSKSRVLSIWRVTDLTNPIERMEERGFIG
jgi:hypothetical protein